MVLIKVVSNVSLRVTTFMGSARFNFEPRVTYSNNKIKNLKKF